MNTTEKKIQEMNVEELVDELMARFSAIHQQLNIIEIQTSHQNRKILHLESKVNAIRSLTGKIQSHSKIAQS
ncbi:MAG: hypothetical protein AAF335_04630 [Bacteroidota bacterium]